MHLDNPAWFALTGPQATVAEGSGNARRFDPDVSVFSAVSSVSDPGAWDDLRTIVGPGGIAALVVDPGYAPRDGWTQLFDFPTVQMVDERVDGEEWADAVRLTVDDVDEMLALVERTKPGPFTRRTIELGEYWGVRDDDGRLVAMAGERLCPPGYREISAVCTDASHRGRGLGTALVRHLVARIRGRGETPILHALADNVNAIRLYESLGFVLRRDVTVLGLQAPP